MRIFHYDAFSICISIIIPIVFFSGKFLYNYFILWKWRRTLLEAINLEFEGLCASRQDEVYRFFWSIDRRDAAEVVTLHKNEILSLDADLERLRSNYNFLTHCSHEKLQTLRLKELKGNSELLDHLAPVPAQPHRRMFTVNTKNIHSSVLREILQNTLENTFEKESQIELNNKETKDEVKFKNDLNVPSTNDTPAALFRNTNSAFLLHSKNESPLCRSGETNRSNIGLHINRKNDTYGLKKRRRQNNNYNNPVRPYHCYREKLRTRCHLFRLYAKATKANPSKLLPQSYAYSDNIRTPDNNSSVQFTNLADTKQPFLSKLSKINLEKEDKYESSVIESVESSSNSSCSTPRNIKGMQKTLWRRERHLKRQLKGSDKINDMCEAKRDEYLLKYRILQLQNNKHFPAK